MNRVLVFGTFDILHPGHIYFLRRARKLGDFLIVSVARTDWVKKIKKKAPFHSERDRVTMLRTLEMPDKVVLGGKKDYIGHILSLKPDIIALGYDQKAFTKDLARKLTERGLKVIIVRIKPYKKQIYKSSKLILS